MNDNEDPFVMFATTAVSPTLTVAPVKLLPVIVTV